MATAVKASQRIRVRRLHQPSPARGIAPNHAFVDGNKRTALVVSEGFLRVNGLKIVSPPEEKYFAFLHLADGSLAEDELTGWFTKHVVPL